jgi:hypothetical protein
MAVRSEHLIRRSRFDVRCSMFNTWAQVWCQKLLAIALVHGNPAIAKKNSGAIRPTYDRAHRL